MRLRYWEVQKLHLFALSMRRLGFFAERSTGSEQMRTEPEHDESRKFRKVGRFGACRQSEVIFCEVNRTMVLLSGRGACDILFGPSGRSAVR